MNSVFAHTRYEFVSIALHPEQLLLLMGTPIATLLVLQNHKNSLGLALAICIMASNFTSIAINTAFARRYGTLKYLVVSPLGKTGIWVSQFLVGCLALLIQLPILLIGAKYFDFSFQLNFAIVFEIPLLIAFCSSLAFLFSTIMSAEKVLALANVFFIAVAGSGIYWQENEFAKFHPLAGVLATGTDAVMYISIYILAVLAIVYVNVKRFRWID